MTGIMQMRAPQERDETSQGERWRHGAAVALNRFGLGTRPDEKPPQYPRRWLLDSFADYRAQPPELASVGSSDQLGARYLQARQEYRAMRSAGHGGARMGRPTKILADRAYAVQAQARLAAAAATPAPFVERLVHFWSNHFAVSADKPAVRALAGTMEFEAIRPHVLGRFADMLLAVERHPAMQLYLDQVKSMGPRSAHLAGRAHVNAGLNENLAREILELHTLGVDGGYTQSDVRELAKAMTGWTVAGFNRAAQGPPGRFSFDASLHEPGERRLLGKRYVQSGSAQAEAMLMELAVHPATAQHIATKLARHFAGDRPPPALVDRLTEAFLGFGGDLAAVYHALVSADEPWVSPLTKFKSPWDWVVSAVRGLRIAPGDVEAKHLLNELDQPIWRPGSPAGWGDTVHRWAGSGALTQRVEMAVVLAQKANPAAAPGDMVRRLLPGTVSERTIAAIEGADSAQLGLTLLLSAPEFLRR